MNWKHKSDLKCKNCKNQVLDYLFKDYGLYICQICKHGLTSEGVE